MSSLDKSQNKPQLKFFLRPRLFALGCSLSSPRGSRSAHGFLSSSEVLSSPHLLRPAVLSPGPFFCLIVHFFVPNCETRGSERRASLCVALKRFRPSRTVCSVLRTNDCFEISLLHFSSSSSLDVTFVPLHRRFCCRFSVSAFAELCKNSCSCRDLNFNFKYCILILLGKNLPCNLHFHSDEIIYL